MSETRVSREPYRECTHFQTAKIHTPRKHANQRTICWKSSYSDRAKKKTQRVTKNETQGGSL